MSPIARPDREDLTPQRERLAAARAGLAQALADLAGECALAQRELRPGRQWIPSPDLPAVYAAVTRVREAEAAMDLAVADLATASGADL